MTRFSVEVDEFLLEAGQCFMYLLWVESTMCDLVVLKEGNLEMRRQYNEAYGKKPHPSEFSAQRLERKEKHFSTIKHNFFKLWPQWKEEGQDAVRESIERVVILRNAFGHAQVQPFRPYLLYNPKSWTSINQYFKCSACLKYLGNCNCPKTGLSTPLCLKLDSVLVNGTYDDIKTIDSFCFYPTAVDLDVKYRGIAWPTAHGGFQIAENRME